MRKEEVTIAEVPSKDENIAIKDNAGGVTGFLERISPEIRDTFTDQQIAAINEAFEPARHSINIRVSLPLPWGRRYFVLLSGNEERNQKRVSLEQNLNPLLTVKNVVPLAIIGFLFVFLAVGLVNMLLVVFL